jgi:hypothetical protein
MHLRPQLPLLISTALKQQHKLVGTTIFAIQRLFVIPHGTVGICCPDSLENLWIPRSLQT